MLILGKTAGAAKTQLHALDGEETSHLAENIPPIASLNFPVGCSVSSRARFSSSRYAEASAKKDGPGGLDRDRLPAEEGVVGGAGNLK